MKTPVVPCHIVLYKHLQILKGIAQSGLFVRISYDYNFLKQISQDQQSMVHMRLPAAIQIWFCFAFLKSYVFYSSFKKKKEFWNAVDLYRFVCSAYKTDYLFWPFLLEYNCRYQDVIRKYVIAMYH